MCVCGGGGGGGGGGLISDPKWVGRGAENTFSSSSFAGLVRRFPNIPEHFLRFPKIFKNCRKIALRTFRFFPKTSADFQNFQKLVGILVFTLSGIFPEFSKEFPKIQQRRHELLLPVTDRPVFFSCMLLIRNHTSFLVQNEINSHK